MSKRVKLMRCSRYGNRGRMHVILNGEQSEEVDCFIYLWSVAADGGCERNAVPRLNGGYRAWGALKSVQSNSSSSSSSRTDHLAHF